MSDYVGTIAAKRYRLYLKEEERKRRGMGGYDLANFIQQQLAFED